MTHSESDSNGNPRSSKMVLPYIAFFWDIENCQVPNNKNAGQIVKFLRAMFADGEKRRRERDFMVVCDINKEHPQTINQLNQEHVTVVHVPCTLKNAADEKLKSVMRKYADTHSPGDVMVLISGDVNFTTELNQVRHERKLDVIIIHPENINASLLSTAMEHYVYSDIVSQVPSINIYENAKMPPGTSHLDLMVIVEGLPNHVPENMLRVWLNTLVSSTGGNVALLSQRDGRATVKFKSIDHTRRGRSHLDKQDAYGSKMRASFHEKSNLYAEQQALHSGIPRPNSLLTFSHSSTQLNGTADGSPSSSSFHHSASVPSGLTVSLNEVFRQLPSATSRFAAGPRTQGRIPFLSHENRPAFVDANRFPIRPPNGMANLPSHILSGQNVPRGPIPPPSQAATSLPESAISSQPSAGNSFFKRKLQERAQATPLQTQPTNSVAVLNNLSEIMDNTFLRNGSSPSDSGKEKSSLGQSPKLGKEIASQLLKEQQRSAASRAYAKLLTENGLDKSVEIEGSSLPDASKNDVANVYFLNLNTEIDQHELYCDLLLQLEEVVPVDHLSIYVDSASTGSAYAHVAVPQQSFATVLIEHFSGMSFRDRTMVVTQENPNRPPSVACRRAVIRLFLVSKKDEMPFVELVSLFRREYDQLLDLAMLRLMPEIVDVKEESVFIVKLLPSAVKLEADMVRQGFVEALPLGYCTKHCPGGATNGTLLKKGYKPLGLYRLVLKDFASRVQQLLMKHGGNLPLNSFVVCFDEYFEKLIVDIDNGSFLEHLLLSVPGVSIQADVSDGPRLLQLGVITKSTDDKFSSFAEDTKIDMVAVGKALIDMLVVQPRSAVALSDFAAAFHRHCGRLCDVRGYDQSRLVRLLHLASHNVQVIGVGADRMVTLTHEAQLKRFSDELVTIRELCDGEEVTEENISALYQVAFDRQFWLGNYGLSDLQDLLEDPGIVKILKTFKPLAMPEILEPLNSLKRLAQETFQLLTSLPEYRDAFVAYPSTFRKLFSRPLRVRDFGFDRLLDLCDAISDVVEIEVVGKERFVSLRNEKRLEHLREVIEHVAGEEGRQLSLQAFKMEFHNLAGFDFKLANYGVATDKEIFSSFENLVEVVVARRKIMLRLHGSNRNQTTKTSLSDSDHSISPEDIASGSNTLLAKKSFSGGGRRSEDRNGDSGISADEQEARRSTFTSPRLAMSFH